MLNEENYITVINEEGNEENHEIIFTFDLEKTGKSYVVLLLEETEEEQTIDVLQYVEGEDGTDGSLFPIESDEEWDMVQEVLNTFLDDEE